MSTYTQSLYQIIFSTKEREKTLSKENRDELYRYIWGVLKNKKCHLYRIGGIEDHVHIITHIHPSIAVADLVKDIKLAGSEFIRKEKLFPRFEGWQVGYGLFTYSFSEKDRLIDYVKNQEQHHHKKTFKEEFIELLQEHNIEFDQRYLL